MLRFTCRSRWIVLSMLLASLLATAPTVRRCPWLWSDVVVAAIAPCTGGAMPLDAPPPPEATPGCDAMGGAATGVTCPMHAGAAGVSCPMQAGATDVTGPMHAGGSGVTECSRGAMAARKPPAGPRARCLIGPSIGSVWRPPLPVVRYPGTAALLPAPTTESSWTPTRVAIVVDVPPPAARDPDSRPPVRGPPSLA
jgi:hypothetical protein